MQDATWDEAQINLLKKLWAEGEAAHAIGAKLGGLSRSAVLGKIFRLRLGPAGTGNKKPTAQTAAAAQSGEPLTRRRRSFTHPRGVTVAETASRRSRRHK
jgi:GcrA cell cycle regulator